MGRLYHIHHKPLHNHKGMHSQIHLYGHMMSYSTLTPAELEAYFKRIGYTGNQQADLPTLRQLHALHPKAIPFENLDSWCGQLPSLEEARVLQKLVNHKRGGYCYEHNQLFLRVLVTLGFSVKPLAARVAMPDAPPLPRTHKVLLVTLDNIEWLVDVGFGGMTMTAPLQLLEGAAQETPHEPWRIHSEDGQLLASALVQQSWSLKYRFSREIQTSADYEMSNWYVAAHPTSRFRNNLIAARVDQGGRHALMNTRYHYHQAGKASIQQDIASAEELYSVLESTFGIQASSVPGIERRVADLFRPH